MTGRRPLKGPIPVMEHPWYPRFTHMRQCVRNPRHADYPNIGARGIKIGPEFEEFWDYVDHIETHLGPAPGPSNIWKIARKDQTKDFTISNMEWAPSKVVGRRMPHSVKLTYKGKTKNLREWAEELGLNFYTILSRHERGWRPEQILGFKPGPKKQASIDRKLNKQKRKK
jgi:hypothetical protein